MHPWCRFGAPLVHAHAAPGLMHADGRWCTSIDRRLAHHWRIGACATCTTLRGKAESPSSIVDIAPLAAYCDSYGRWRTATEGVDAMAETRTML
jgi:hypothetical protein